MSRRVSDVILLPGCFGKLNAKAKRQVADALTEIDVAGLRMGLMVVLQPAEPRAGRLKGLWRLDQRSSNGDRASRRSFSAPFVGTFDGADSEP